MQAKRHWNKRKTAFEAHSSNLKQKQKDDTKDAPTRAKLKQNKTNMTNEIIFKKTWLKIKFSYIGYLLTRSIVIYLL